MIPNMTQLRIGSTIELDGGEYRVVEYGGGFFKLRGELSDEYLIIDHLELARRIPRSVQEGSVENAAPEPTIAVLVDKLDEFGRRLVPHLQELIDATPAVGSAPRAEYDLSQPMTWRLEAKLLELHREGIDIEIATLKRKLKRYKQSGPAGLVDRRGLRSEPALGRADERVVECLAAILAESIDKSTSTLTKVRAELAERLMVDHPGAGVELPSVATIRRYVNILDGGRKVLGSAVQRQSISNVPKRAFSARLATAPGQEVQVDSTKLDVFVRTSGGVERPTLTIMIDKATRSIIASSIRLGAATGHDHAVLLARCLVPKPLRPGTEYYSEHDLPELEWSRYLTAEQRLEYDVRRPYIVPQRIITDNGADFVSDVFRSACARYGISLTESAPGTPTDKAQVERMFGTIRTKFSQFLPGYSGGRTEFRGTAPEGEGDLFDLDTLNELFDRWVGVVWQNRRHDGLVDPRAPHIKHTPNTMYSALLDLTGYIPVALVEEDYVELLPRERRTIQTDGIEFRSRMYDSVHLGPHRSHRDDRGRALLYDVHFDPNNLQQIWVRPELEDDWITCEWKEADGLSRPHLAATMRKAHQLTLQRGGFTDDEADDITIAAVKDAHAVSAQRDLDQLNQLRETIHEHGLNTTSPAPTEPDWADDDFTELDTF
ncbi:Mu transposase C-terminal domain-containing protein [Agromyces sp. Leaf222]|uniref:Mu transposase C-terminal domain-containing protein n=1 Tax=Agromyces sp. Leaf222 TaxID=1735688 RepID=UPI000700E505|nr:Mu transposase C-terminal domain-containing protein [Agromyces sp. Leaf222]KQM82411.1 hypothetical protein ASE68_03185 [Agromyces sp. Leaf222]